MAKVEQDAETGADDALLRLVSSSSEILSVCIADTSGKKRVLPIDVVACCSSVPSSIKPSAADLAELKKLAAELDLAVSAQAEGWDATALRRAFAPILHLVQTRQSSFEHRIRLTRKVLSEGAGEERELAEVPHGLLTLQRGEVRHLSIESAFLQSLPPWIARLEHLETLTLNGTSFGGKRLRLKELPPSLWRLKVLKTLRLEFLDGLKAFPEPPYDLRQDSSQGLESLETLSLQECHNLKVLPHRLGKLKTLKTLELRGLRIDSLPYTVKALSALETLCIHRCIKVKTLPTDSFQLRSLKKIEVVRLDQLTDLFEDISTLRALEVLRVCGCPKLKAMPRGIGALRALKTLEAQDMSRLHQWPDGLLGLVALENLRIVNCENITGSFPVREMKALQTLELNGLKRISRVPDGLGALSTLERLKITSCNNSWKLPNIGGLKSLQDFELEGDSFGACAFPDLTNSIGDLEALKTLTLKRLAVEELPKSLGKLGCLECLYILECPSLRMLPQLGPSETLELWGLNSLKELPHEVGAMSMLRNLKIGRCGKIQTLPPSFGQLHVLQTLEIKELSALEKIPDEVGRGLGALTTFKISACSRFKKLPTLEGLGSLKTFTLEDLTGLEELPSSVMHLTALQVLSISKFPLEDIPRLDTLTTLQTLILLHKGKCRSNFIASLSRSLPALQQLRNLSLSSDAAYTGLTDEDKLHVMRSLKAWPPPLLKHLCVSISMRPRPAALCDILKLPWESNGWSNGRFMDYFRLQQTKFSAFSAGTHARLGAHSRVAMLNDQSLVMIADEILGGWTLIKEWNSQEQ